MAIPRLNPVALELVFSLFIRPDYLLKACPVESGIPLLHQAEQILDAHKTVVGDSEAHGIVPQDIAHELAYFYPSPHNT